MFSLDNYRDSQAKNINSLTVTKKGMMTDFESSHKKTVDLCGHNYKH